MSRYVPLKPQAWPQDDLNVPNGMGGMPPIARSNAVLGSEFFAVAGMIAVAAGTPAQSVFRLAMPTPQDGDFWCDAIGVVSWDADTVTIPATTQDTQQFLISMVSIKDQRTGRDLIFNHGLTSGLGAGQVPLNSVPVNLFRKLPQSGAEVDVTYDGSVPVPAGFRSTGSLIQPFCFTRQGGIELIMTTLFAAPAGHNFSVWFAFTGWKEYANASR